MKSSNNHYLTPTVTTLMLETEQMVCAQSNAGGNENLFDDPDDYDGLFD